MGDPLEKRSVSYMSSINGAHPQTDYLEVTAVDAKPKGTITDVLVESGNTSNTVSRSGSCDSDGSDTKPDQAVTFRELYRFGNRADMINLAWACFFALLQGAAWPMLFLLFGEALSTFSDGATLTDEMNKIAIYFVIIGLVMFFVTGINQFLFHRVAARIMTRVREYYLDAVLRQEMEWHDRNPAAQLEVRLASNIPKMQAALGAKFGFAFMNFGTGIAGITLGMVYSWKLCLVFIAVAPVFAGAVGMMLYYMMNLEQLKTKAYEGMGVCARNCSGLDKII